MPKRLSCRIVVPLLLCCLGCAPTISYRIDTSVQPDGTCVRKVIVRGTPHKRFPKQQVKLQDYLDLPEAEAYEHFVLTPSSLILGGRFESPQAVPSDFSKPTMHSEKVAQNRIYFRHIDLVLVRFMDYEERVEDIVARVEGEEALQKVVDMLLTELLSALDKRYGKQYDLTGLKLYLREEVPRLTVRLYGRLWEIRRARRGGIVFQSERQEWEAVIGEEARRYGINLKPGPAEKADKRNREVLTAFVNQRLIDLTTPKTAGNPPLQVDFLRDKDAREEFLKHIQASVEENHGSVQTFIEKLEPLLPVAFGAFLINEYSLLPTNPHFDFQVRLSLPGTIIQTNGLIDVNGKLLWSFAESDMGLSGYAMWARSLVINQEAINALGLHDFPDGLNTVESYFRTFRGAGGRPNKELVELVRACVTEKSLDPLARRAAAAAMGGEKDYTARAAADLHKLLAYHQQPRSEREAANPQPKPSRPSPTPVSDRDPLADPLEPEIEELGGGGLTAPGQESGRDDDKPEPEETATEDSHETSVDPDLPPPPSDSGEEAETDPE